MGKTSVHPFSNTNGRFMSQQRFSQESTCPRQRLHWGAPTLGYVEDIVSLMHCLFTLSGDISRFELDVRDCLIQQEHFPDDKWPSSTPKIENRLSRPQGRRSVNVQSKSGV